MTDFSKRFRVVSHEGLQLSPVENRIVEAIGDEILSIRDVSKSVKLSVMAVYSSLQKLAEKKAVCELEAVEVKAA
ncbi:MAG: hypothetical protein WBF90_36910 [Rivularia sp. (in: cyanobacteria)]